MLEFVKISAILLLYMTEDIQKTLKYPEELLTLTAGQPHGIFLKCVKEKKTLDALNFRCTLFCRDFDKFKSRNIKIFSLSSLTTKILLPSKSELTQTTDVSVVLRGRLSQ